MSSDDTNMLADAMGDVSGGEDQEALGESTELDMSPRDVEPESDAPVRASEIDWVALWNRAGFGTNGRASTTQMKLAVELSDETAIQDHGAAVGILSDAREQGDLVGRQIGGCVVEWWIAPHLVEKSE